MFFKNKAIISCFPLSICVTVIYWHIENVRPQPALQVCSLICHQCAWKEELQHYRSPLCHGTALCTSFTPAPQVALQVRQGSCPFFALYQELIKCLLLSSHLAPLLLSVLSHYRSLNDAAESGPWSFNRELGLSGSDVNMNFPVSIRF